MDEKKILQQLWQNLHELAEVSFQEYETTAFLIDYFAKHGLKAVPFQSIPGFYVEIGSGRSPIVGLRADMDALLQEVDGKLQANHSCGHDAHMTIVTGVMLRLKEQAASLNGTIRAIFQPAEEQGNGAVAVVAEGVIDDLDYLFGVHIRPQNELPFPHCAPNIQHGACAFIQGQIYGQDHHGARPNEGVNAIEIGSTIVQLLQQIHTPPSRSASVKMTKFHAGTDNLNIIPGEATFGIDLRAQENDVMDFLRLKTIHILEQVKQLYNVKLTYSVVDEVPAAVLNAQAERVLQTALEQEIEADFIQPCIQTSGSDDFHFYSILKPDLQAAMLALGADVTPGLHAPSMTFNKAALQNGVAVLERTCLLLCQ